MANFKLSTASISDTNELGHLMAKAYQDEPIQNGLMPFELIGDYWGLFLRNDCTRAGEHYYKVTDTETGKIVAFAKVRYPAPFNGDEEFQEEPPKGTNVELFEHWFENMDKYHHKHSDYVKDYYLHVLCVHPDYQRKGLGKMLLERFLKDADRDNAKSYLQATAKGEGLYLQCGWKHIEDMVTNTPKGPVVWKCMMRNPRPEQAK